MKCAKRDKLRNRAAHILGVLVKLGNEQIECLKRDDQKRLREVDKRLDLYYGKKERALGALREHTEEHGC